MDESSEHHVLVLTGPAGAGRSTAINILEDNGYEAIDNLPMQLLPRLLTGEPHDRPIAIGIDTRTRGFTPENLLEFLAGSDGERPTLMYLDCQTETLLRRFTETRRRHPAAPAESPLVGIRREAELLAPLRKHADILIDTTSFSPHDLKAEMSRLFGWTQTNTLAVSIESFSYKRGTPSGVDMIIDCRFLQNPHWIEELRPKTGKDPEVVAYIKEDPLFGRFFNRLGEFSTFLLPAYQREGKSYFSIGLGCSGGRHRSVCVAEELAKLLAEAGWQVSIRHRELERHN